ncbi:FprA family A-type flavoprotein [Anaerocaecibacter muris]|uniref:FprA family A-type flavoprotein n=1 Tax=Anaerocaecibacter muris TaxID=2941513 RepID=UPI003F68F9FD
MQITNEIKYVGVNDRTIDLFEGQYVVPNGVSYNSYVIIDDKIAVFDTVDKRKTEDWLSNVENVLGGKKPDYLVISHMEPDHSASIDAFLKKYPSVTVVGNEKTFNIAERFFGDIFKNKLVVKEGEELSLGKHNLKFVFAPMVHWPEVMFTYETTEKVLFSADAFGKFGALDVDEEWACEARRYYFNIVGKYGATVQSVLKKAAALDIKIICPLHGPVLNENLEYYIGKYNIWSSYQPEDKGVLIAYASIYGNTAKAAEQLAELLRENGEKVAVADLARCDMAEAIEDAFRYDRLVTASVTYDGGLFPAMESFLSHLKAKNYQNRTVAFIENGSWAPMSGKLMRGFFDGMKNITVIDKLVTVKSAVKDDTKEELKQLAAELVK